MFAFGLQRPRRRPGLTPMIDVVFLLLVFFMLAARFGQSTGVELSLAGSGGEWQGPPRLVIVSPTGVSLNGVAVAVDELPDTLLPLMPSVDAPVIVQPANSASLQQVLDTIEVLRAADFKNVVLTKGMPQ